MRRLTPALCVGFLLAIPIVGIGMHEPGSATPALAELTPAGASPYAAAIPSAMDALGTGAPDLALAQAAVGSDAFGAAPSFAQGQGRFMDSVVAVASTGIPVMEPPAVVTSPPSAPSAGAAVASTPFAAAPQALAPQTGNLFATAPTVAAGPLAASAPWSGPSAVAPASPGGGDNMVALYPTVPGPSAPASAAPLLGAASAVPTVPTIPAAPALPLVGAVPDAAPAAQEADPLAAWGPPPAPLLDPRRFTEAHWQGLELVPNTPRLAAMLKLPPDVPGVVVDDVTLPADLQGFQAGDLVTHVAQTPTPHLLAFIRATERVRDEQQARVDLVRGGQPVALTLTALLNRLETANGDSPPMIPAGARMPHPYRGPCTNCHRIGTTGALGADQGDAMTKTAPDLRVGARRPHEDRGPCSACHRIFP